MEFCTKCGTILRVKKRGPQKIFYCDCGYKVFSDNDFILKDKIDNDMVTKDEFAEFRSENTAHIDGFIKLHQTLDTLRAG